MTTAEVQASLPIVGGKKTTLEHPLGPLTAAEILQSSQIIKSSWPAEVVFQFKSVTLEEPKKAELVPYLAAEHSGSALPKIDRRSFVVYYIKNTVSLADWIPSPLFSRVAVGLNRSRTDTDMPSIG